MKSKTPKKLFILPKLSLRGTQLAGWTPKVATQLLSKGVLFQEDIEIPLPDGTLLKADLFLPEAMPKAPALIAWAAYIKDTDRLGGGPFIDEQGAVAYIVQHGYAFLRIQPRGTGASGGQQPEEIFSPQEAQDCHDAIEWVASQSWCDGKVGMSGMSYFGMSQLRAAATNPPHLKAIFPLKAMTDVYRLGFYKGGAPYTGALELFAAAEKSVPPKLPSTLRHILSHLINRPPFLTQMSDAAANQRKFRKLINVLKPSEAAARLYVTRLFDRAFDDATWRESSATSNMEDIDIPICIGMDYGAMGFHFFGAFELWHRLKKLNKDIRLFLGPPEYEFPWTNYHEEMLAWYDWQLKGIDNGYADLPPVRYFLTGAEEWQSAQDWPPLEAKPCRLYLAAGSAGALQMQELQTASPSASTQSFLAISSASYYVKAMDKYEAQVLQYATEPYAVKTRIVGPVHLHLMMSASAIDTYLMARISDIAPDGKRRKLAFGWLLASHRTIDAARSNPTEIIHDHHPEAAKQLVPHVAERLSFSLTAITHEFQPGHRLLFEIGSRPELLCTEKGEGFDMFLWDPVPYPSRNTIHHGGAEASYLDLQMLPC
jgi:putative CocE/NonD family hydrolase